MSVAAPERPISVLRDEHRTIVRVLGVLQRLLDREAAGTFEVEDLARCVDFFRSFADACHHAKEEDLLFPVLEERGVPREGGPIGVMLAEHVLARRLTAEMGDALAASRTDPTGGRAAFRRAAEAYLGLLGAHIFKEDHVLFEMGEDLMSDADQRRLCRRFGEVGCRAFGGRTRDELEAMADELEGRWPAA